MMQRILLLVAVGSAYAVPLQDRLTPRAGESCGYESCHATKPGFLNVHIVPHTHDDVGWLKTVDQYYYGSRNNIQKAGVQYILDSVVKELWEDPKRRFIYVETAFFWKWWVRQSDAMQQKVHTLVREGRLQFVGGAWSMNDEAAAHYQSIIDQFTWGLSKLNQTFGVCGRPRVGWQIDPFGHSREFANLLAMMGYDGLFLGRIDYQDKSNRLKRRNMEMVWRGDDELGNASDIFTGVLHNTYSPPPGFCFDVLCSDEPIIDDPDSPMYNVASKIGVFIDTVKNQARYYRTNNVIITMGGDFTYQDATMWYKNLDKLIEYSNMKAAKDNLNVTLFYSTPDCYLKAIKDANPTLPTKKDDFFPYASDSTAYWTGYFTSRPTTKYFERQGNSYLQVVKQLQVLADLEKHNQFVLNELRSAMGVMQHHDAITGTEKQHVTHDYERLLNQAIDDALIIAKQAFNKLTLKDATKPPIFEFQRCHLNESRCDISENSEKFVVTVYNPVGWSVLVPVRIPVVDGRYEVYGPDGSRVKCQFVRLASIVQEIPTRVSKATQEIVFLLRLGPLSYKSLYIKKVVRDKRNSNNNYDFYSNLNNYWKNVKEPIINRLDDDSKEITIAKDTKDTEIPLPPIYSPEITNADYRDANLDLLKDGKNDQELADLESLLREVRKKDDKEWDKVKSVYSNLSEEEMRMLSDEPRVVERFDDEFVENEYFKLELDSMTGEIKQVTLADGTSVDMLVSMGYYSGSCGDNHMPSHRSSGAYIFRPYTMSPTELKVQSREVLNGPVVLEYRYDLFPNAHFNVKTYVEDLNYFEIEWLVGPIPIIDDIGKEYILKYGTNLNNHGVFYTDSNGRQLIKRELNYRPTWNVSLAEPVAGNYYPVTNLISIEGGPISFSVLTDRSEGGSSLLDGEIELMLHRRLLCDDAFGVNEALNETAMNKGLVARGNHRVIINADSSVVEREVLGLHLPPLVFFSDAENIQYDEWLKLNNAHSFLVKELPKGVHLLTLEPWDTRLLLRFENYHSSHDVSVDIRDIFKDIEIRSVREAMLAANMWADEYEQWVWNKEGKTKPKKPVRNDFVVKLKPKQIRTFVAEYGIKGR